MEEEDGKGLVLSRRRGERILIGEDITVEVLDARGGKAKLAVSAPPEFEIDREEVRERKNIDRGRA